jgi:hypothetical protein
MWIAVEGALDEQASQRVSIVEHLIVARERTWRAP